MNLKTTLPAAIGAAFAGGFFAGLISDSGQTFALIAAPKIVGEHKAAWNATSQAVTGATSYSNGLVNTNAMGEAGSALAQWARELDIDGHVDWYIPSRDELEVIYRNLKPTVEENTSYYRSGDNPSSVPTGYPYTANLPAQAAPDAFKAGGPEALEDEWYWSSTQHAADPSIAWGQLFSYGIQVISPKSYEGRARAVRRLPI
jgi:hypothetical protein